MMHSERAHRITVGAAVLLALFLVAASWVHVSAAERLLDPDAAVTDLTRVLASGSMLFGVCLLAMAGFLGTVGAVLRPERAEPVPETALERLEALEALVDHSGDLLTIKDPQGRYLRVNAHFGELFNVQPEDASGLSDYDIFAKLVADTILNNDQKALANAHATEVEETILYDGVSHTFRSRRVVLRDAQGEPRALCTVATEAEPAAESEDEGRRQEAKDVYQAQKLEAVGTLAGGLAHDFNNVLTAVLGGLEMALRGVPEEDGKLRKRLLRVQKAAHRAADLTRQLLTLSRPTQAVKGMTDINVVVKAATQLLARSIPDNIEVRTWLDKELPSVLADAGQVEQALLNLGVNARDALSGGGRITFETKIVHVDADTAQQHVDAREGRYVRITVSDNGTGISRRVIDRIFEPFFTTKEVGKGTGLGLAMVRSCVKAHEGWLSLDSVVGRGTTFALYLPVTEVVEDVGTPGVGEGDGLSDAEIIARYGGTETILAVDDEADVLDLVSSGLAEFGYRVLTADDGEHAVAVLTQNDGDVRLILTDLVMPKCGGDKLLRIVRNRGYTLPVVLMSGYVPPSSDDVFRDKDFAAIIHKPFTPGDLAQLIRHTLDGKPTTSLTS